MLSPTGVASPLEQHALARREALAASRADEAAWMRTRRAEAWSRFLELGLPGPRTEDWRFTNPRTISQRAYVAEAEPGFDPSELPPVAPGTWRAVFVDGRFAPEHSAVDGLPAGVRFGSLSACDDQEFLQAHLGALRPAAADAFDALDEALFEDGALLHLAAGTVLDRPLHLLHWTSGGDELCHGRVLVVLERGASARLVQHAASQPSTRGLASTTTELHLGAGARLDHLLLQEESTQRDVLQRVGARLDRDAQLDALSIAWGGRVARTEFVATLAGENAEVRLDGLYLPARGQHIDHTLLLRHERPHTRSRQNFKGILSADGRAVFRGRVYVAPDAQKIEAHQSNRNLLLSRRAWVDTLPQLEIYADDVKCTHGATVGRLDGEALHYLRARGLDAERARALLTFAFAGEILEEIEDPELRARLEARLEGWLAAERPEEA